MTAPVAPARRLGLASLLGLALASVPGARAQWAIETVERATYETGDASLKVSPSGEPVVAFGGTTLELARWDGARWNAERVADAACGILNPSLALDAAGTPAIAYIDRDTGDLRYASWTGSAWSTERVASVGVGTPIAWHTVSLALDPAGDASIAYHDAGSGALAIARWDGTAWRSEVVDAPTRAVSPSLAIDGAGNPLVAYVDGPRGLLLARWNGTAWTRELVDGNPDLEWSSSAASLALDSAGNPAIAYAGQSAVSTGQLRLARWDGLSWTLNVRDDPWASEVTGLAIDSLDRAVIVYLGHGSADPYDHLASATWAGSTWTVNGIVDMSSIIASSMALDPAGMPVTSFVGSLNFGLPGIPLGSAMWRGGAWAFDAFGGDISVRPGGTTSLALDSAGHPHLAWSMSGDASQLRYAAFDGSTWTRETVASPCANPGCIWDPVSLALDVTGAPRIAFGGDALRYARWDGASWIVETVDPTGAWLIALALDAAGNPALAYAAGFELKYARFDGAAWAIESVDAITAADQGISMALDGAGNPSIVYFDASTEELKYARSDGSAWSMESVAGAQVDYSWASLVLDGAGNPIVAYNDLFAVRVARRIGTAWTVETAADAYLPAAVSLALDPAGRPSIGYRSEPMRGGGLFCARWDGTLWTSQTVEIDDGDYRDCALRVDASGTPWIAYAGYTACNDGVRLAHLAPRAAVLYRGVVAGTAPGWRAGSLPLTAANDDETPPFPLATEEPASADDALGATAPLVLYRLLLDGTTDAGNVLVAVKRPGRVHLHY